MVKIGGGGENYASACFLQLCCKGSSWDGGSGVVKNMLRMFFAV